MSEPGHLEKALKAIKFYIILWFVFSGLLVVGGYFLASSYFELEPILVAASLGGIWIILGIIIGSTVANKVSKPLEAVGHAILHVSPSPIPVAAPNIERIGLGRELVANLVRQVYDYASKSGVLEAPILQTTIDFQQLPLGIIGLDADSNITFANPKVLEYAHTTETITGKNLYNVFDILFRDETLGDWLKYCEANTAVAQKTWRGIRMNAFGEKTQYFDLAVHYTKNSDRTKTQTIITMFDQNEIYGTEENSLSFIALAVHELRTPLTILRGYIEVMEDEVKEGGIKPELAEFVRKMQASAENLTAFVNNILNVAKVEEDQLSLKLHEENWSDVLTKIVDDLKLRAEVHGKHIELVITPDIPSVGIDRISIAEVITNLIDNAIKYSPKDKTLIKVDSHITQDGLVETVVQDFGVGIPTQVMPHLFEKFSRNYRNQKNISGTGLGLYLSKALVRAHGGNIWVRSQEGQGSEFGFTIVPYAKLGEAEKNGANQEIIRNAHGWIKNHSLSRR